MFTIFIILFLGLFIFFIAIGHRKNSNPKLFYSIAMLLAFGAVIKIFLFIFHQILNLLFLIFKKVNHNKQIEKL